MGVAFFWYHGRMPADRVDLSQEAQYVPACWSCWREFREGEGVSIDESGFEHVCQGCWDSIDVAGRLYLGLAFRRLEANGFGVVDLIEAAISRWPFGTGPSRN